MTNLNSKLTVGDVAIPRDLAVVLAPTDLVRRAVEVMSERRLGIACVLDSEGRLEGVFTDGDIRRILLVSHKPIAAIFSEDIGDHVTRSPRTISPETALEEAVSILDAMDVYDLPVIDSDGRLIGLLHMHTALHHLLNL